MVMPELLTINIQYEDETSKIWHFHCKILVKNQIKDKEALEKMSEKKSVILDPFWSYNHMVLYVRNLMT